MYNRDVLCRWSALAAALVVVAGCDFEHGQVGVSDGHVDTDRPADVAVDTPVFAGQVGMDDFTDGETSSAAVFTRNHTVGTQPMRLLVVAISISSVNTSVSSLTYGGTALTLVGIQNASQGHIEIWKLDNPASGTAAVTLTMTNALATMSVGIGSYFNVHPTLALSPLAAAVGTSGDPRTTIASGPGQIVETVVMWHQTNTTLTSPEHLQWERVLANQIGAGSTTDGAPTVTPSFTVANGATAPWAIAAVAIRPGG